MLGVEWLRRRSRSSGQEAAIVAQGAEVTRSPVAQGSGISQTVNNLLIQSPVNGGAATALTETTTTNHYKTCHELESPCSFPIGMTPMAYFSRRDARPCRLLTGRYPLNQHTGPRLLISAPSTSRAEGRRCGMVVVHRVFDFFRLIRAVWTVASPIERLSAGMFNLTQLHAAPPAS